MTVQPLRVLRVYHSAVVGPWRRRDAELRRLGLDVTTVAPRRWDEGGRDVTLAPEPGEPVEAVRTAGRHPFRFAYEPFALWRVLRRVRPEVLDVHEEPASLAAFEVVVLARLAGVRAPFCLYSAENLPKRYPPPFRWTERFLLRRAAAVHSCNDAVEHRLREKGFSGPVRNLGLGVDVAAFGRTAPAGAQPLAEDGAPAAPQPTGDRPGSPQLHVGFVGRLDERKGIFVLLDAIGGLPQVRVTFVGAGSAGTRLAAEIAKRGLGDRAVIEGFVDPATLPSVYRRFDAVAVPSLDTPRSSEQFGRVAVEAMAGGVAVVASDVGALREVLGDAGLLVPQGDVASLRDALEVLASEPARRRDIASAARVRAAYFGWDELAQRQAELYSEIVGSSAAAMARPAASVKAAS